MALGSRFVVVGVDTTDSGPAAYTSPNGSTWTEQSVPGTASLNAVIAGGPRFVAPLSAAVSGDELAVSLDAETWTLEDSGVTAGVLGVPGVFGGDLYVSADGTASYTSDDGITWTQHTGALPNSTWRQMAYGNGTFVVVGATNGGNTIAYSTDGENWSEVTNTTGWGTITYGGGLFVVTRLGAVGQEGDAKTDFTMTSPDGATWTPRDSFGGAWYQSAYTNGRFVVIGDGFNAGETPTNFATLMSSTDGVTWSYARHLTLGRVSSPLRGLAGGGGVFVYAPPFDNEIWTSTDGSSWSSQGTFTDRSWEGIAHYQANSRGWKVGSL